jgi:hypothetical protein
LGPLDFEDYPMYESCLEDKMTKGSFFTKWYRAKDLLEFVHIDVCDPMSVQTRRIMSISSRLLMITQGMVMYT